MVADNKATGIRALPQPAQPLGQELRHVHAGGVDLVEDHGLARRPCHPLDQK
ncbi:hypothetical protein [Actinomadura formosensis]|uniref:hypothetical protein n=1 Tax=Actinomadura formosensis TaxID=60706 RepID=UPI003D92A000